MPQPTTHAEWNCFWLGMLEDTIEATSADPNVMAETMLTVAMMYLAKVNGPLLAGRKTLHLGRMLMADAVVSERENFQKRN